MQRTASALALAAVATLSLAHDAAAQGCIGAGGVVSKAKISMTSGGFTGDPLNFGWFTSPLPDLDGNGIADLAVGNPNGDPSGLGFGEIWILFLNPDGTVDHHQKISSTEGGFGGQLDQQDYFGSGVTNLGDLDGDGVSDIAAGSEGDSDGGWYKGAVWVLFMKSDGTVKAQQKISSLAGGFTGSLEVGGNFGSSVAGLGDLDGDGVEDLAVGAREGSTSTGAHGSVWALFLKPNGTVKSYQKLSSQLPGGNGTSWGLSLAPLSDFDGNGTTDLIVGGNGNDLRGPLSRGSICVVCLNPNGSVGSLQRIGPGLGGFSPVLDESDGFGRSVSAIGDLDGDGVQDLAVGTPGDDDGGPGRGATYLLFLKADKTVKSEQKISTTAGDFGFGLDDYDTFGMSVSHLGDLSGDGLPELAVGAPGDDDGGGGRGAIWILSLNPDSSTPPPIGDVNNDCRVDAADLALLLGAWGGSDPIFDLDGDGAVGAADLAILLGAWTE